MLSKAILKDLPGVRTIVKSLDNLNQRVVFVERELKSLPAKSLLLDAGCGSQQFRKYAEHLEYRGQDFGSYSSDEKQTFATPSSADQEKSKTYEYGELDYEGNIWEIKEASDTFDAILCTEVFEHIQFPAESVKEFHRLLKPGAKLILTVPSNCLRHMDPYFFFSGFSDRWLLSTLSSAGFEEIKIEPVGDYYRWLAVEIMRTMVGHGIVARLFLPLAFIYYYSKKPTRSSVDTLCMGYHVTATKALEKVY